uniref:hypothetical protein n=1 Tax=Listeria monocytogenes TaxID=1639 RepID=UPI0031F7C401
MKKNLRMLALGFLISAVVLLVYNQFFSTQTKADETKATSTKAGSDENSSTWKNKYEKLLAAINCSAESLFILENTVFRSKTESICKSPLISTKSPTVGRE